MVFNTQDRDAQKFLEQWSKMADFYTKFEGLVTTILICGNAIFEKLDEVDGTALIRIGAGEKLTIRKVDNINRC